MNVISSARPDGGRPAFVTLRSARIAALDENAAVALASKEGPPWLLATPLPAELGYFAASEGHAAPHVRGYSIDGRLVDKSARQSQTSL